MREPYQIISIPYRIVNDTTLFCIFHRTNGDYWQFIAGGGENNEKPIDTALREIKEETGLPVIGLIKREYPGFQGRITMTMREVDECMAAGADVVSIDCTDCVRGDGLTPTEFLKAVREEYPNIIIMADCAAFEEAVAAHAAGADLVGTTMNGYTPQTAGETGEPNFALVEQLARALPCPVIAEGRVHTPEQARRMLEQGAWAVVVGGAITRPLEIASRFMAAVHYFPGGRV